MKSGIDTPYRKAEKTPAKQPHFESGKGKGIHLKAMQPFYDFVFDHLVDRAELYNGDVLIPQNGRPVVIITSHGPGFAWVPILALAGKYYVDHGLGDLVGGMYPHRAVFWVPGLKSYYKRVLGTPTQINTVEDLVYLLKNREIQVTGTAPEGSNSLFSFKEYVGPFRSRGMIAAAIRGDADLVIAAHQGAETWNRILKLPFGMSIRNTFGTRGMNVPLPPYKKLDRYVAVFKRYKPTMTAEDFQTMSARETSLKLNLEAEKMRVEMNLMTDQAKMLLARNQSK